MRLFIGDLYCQSARWRRTCRPIEAVLPQGESSHVESDRSRVAVELRACDDRQFGAGRAGRRDGGGQEFRRIDDIPLRRQDGSGRDADARRGFRNRIQFQPC